MAKWTVDDMLDQTGRTVFVTGASSGLGLRSAEALASRGARVLMGCRDQEQAAEALEAVKNAAAASSPEVVPLDLAYLDAVRACAERLCTKLDHLDVLRRSGRERVIPSSFAWKSEYDSSRALFSTQPPSFPGGRRFMTIDTETQWTVRGTVMVACNCDYGCPCNFNARPSKGKCEGQWTWHVEEGQFGATPLTSLNFTVAVNWPGAIHEGDGEALILIDGLADEAQRQAISQLVGGNIGGPWGVLAWTWPKVHGPMFVPYEVDVNGIEWRVKAGTSLEIESTTIKNPVSGAEVHPSAILPEGIVFKQGDFGASTVFRVDGGVHFEHPGQYTAVAPFDYSGPE